MTGHELRQHTEETVPAPHTDDGKLFSGTETECHTQAGLGLISAIFTHADILLG